MKLNKKEKEYLQKLLSNDISETKQHILNKTDMNEKLERDMKFQLLWDIENAVSIRAKLEADTEQEEIK